MRLAKNLIFEITQRCNCNCQYCYNVWKNNTPYPAGELSTWRLKWFLGKVIRESGAGFVTLTGGEPLLRKDLEKIVKFLRKLDVEVNIITNATLFTEERIKNLIDLGVSVFELPLLSSHREVHNQLMRADSFDAITEALVKIKKYSGKVVSVFVATKINIADFGETAKLSFALGADGIMFNRFNPGGEGAKHIKQLLPAVQEVEEALRVANEFSEKYKLGISCSIPIQPCLINTKKFDKIGFGFCSAGTERAYYTIDPIGNLRMCNHSELILGNLFRESFAEIISQESVRNFVNTLPKYCRRCRLKDTCQGGCKASSEVCYGSLIEEEPFLRMNKIKVRELINA